MSSRDLNSDTAKHGPQRTKADASVPAQWRKSMGEWDAPGQQLVTDTDSDGPDDAIERNSQTGPMSDSPRY